jgi:polysaccharide biosynthesis transport protein
VSNAPVTRRIDAELVLDALRKRWLFLLVPLVLVPTTALVTRGVVGPKLKASAQILVQDSMNVNPILKDLGVGLAVNTRIPEIASMLRSQPTVERVLRRLGELDHASSARSVAGKVGAFRSQIEVWGEGGGLIRVSLVGRSADKVVRGVRLLTEALMVEAVRPQREVLDNTVRFLEPQLERVKEELTSIEGQLRAFRKENANYLPEVRDLKLAAHAELTKAMLEAEAALVSADSTLELVEAQLSKRRPSQGGLRSEVSRKRRELNELLETYTARHPQVVAARSDLTRLRSKLTQGSDPDELRRYLARGKLPDYGKVLDDVQSNRQKVIFLGQRVKASTLELQSFASYEQQLRQLERTHEAKSKGYVNLLERYEDAVVTRELARSENASDFRVVEISSTPHIAGKSTVLFVGVGGLLGGLLFGFGLVFLMEFLDRTVRTREEASEVADAAVLGSLPG